LVADWAQDNDWEKRFRAAQQQGVDVEVLHRLAADDNPVVRGAVFANPGCDAQCLTILVAMDPSTLSQALGHHECTPELLQQAADSTDVRMHLAAAKHHKCPGDTLVRLLASNDPQVRRAALNNPSLPEQYSRLATVSDERRISLLRSWMAGPSGPAPR
jgi:hypothetical protein